MSDHAARIQDDALAVLQEVLDWELSSPRWNAIAGILDALAVSLDQGDLDTVVKATIQLEQAGPVRVTMIGATPTEPPPPPVRERANQLIHRLSGGTEAGT
jgi:hypothetical protein